MSNLKPVQDHSLAEEWELFSDDLGYEYHQAIDEGLDVESIHGLFEAICRLPRGPHKEALSDILFRMISDAKTREGYPYEEPSDLDGILALAQGGSMDAPTPPDALLKEKIAGAWYGRIAGCLLGKPVEGARTNELIPFLEKCGNYPLKRYMHRSDFEEADVKDYWFPFARRPYIDQYDGMPSDDDTNYMVLYQELIEESGREFTSADVAKRWIASQPKNAYCTAERVAFRNFIMGYAPPHSATYKNPWREWIGAQIRGDYFGYICPGKPLEAAKMAYRDACISHTKNGIYGEMFASAMIAASAVTDDLHAILREGLAVIPRTSRLYEKVSSVIADFDHGMTKEEMFEKIHRDYNEHDQYDWCHTIPNAVIVAACLLYGGGEFGRSICMAVETGFDTDCNGATVGSVLGMRNGIGSIGEEWIAPLNDTLYTKIFGMDKVKISDRVEMTLKHIRK